MGDTVPVEMLRDDGCTDRDRDMPPSDAVGVELQTLRQVDGFQEFAVGGWERECRRETEQEGDVELSGATQCDVGVLD